jgi:hypothetical protein
MKRPYVLGIGLPKTGTLTLAKALDRLGWRALHDHNRGKRMVQRNRESGLPLLAGKHRFTAFSDNPWPQVYREIDAQYPGTLFIYTVREMEAWLKSRIKHAERNRRNPRYRGGWTKVNVEKATQRYVTHDAEVRDYFAGREGVDFLVMDICKPDGDRWGPLCKFLGVPRPKSPFPHKNKASVLERRVAGFEELERRKEDKSAQKSKKDNGEAGSPG